MHGNVKMNKNICGKTEEKRKKGCSEYKITGKSLIVSCTVFIYFDVDFCLVCLDIYLLEQVKLIF